MAHPYHGHREQQVAHRRVGTMLKGEPSGATRHAGGDAYSTVTSKTAAMNHDDIGGKGSNNRFARGGKVKHGNTNIAIVLPGAGKGAPPAMPMAGPPPGPGPGLPPPPMGGPPPGGMPMHARGGKVLMKNGASTKGDIAASAKRAEKNSFARGGMTAGAESGEGRLQKARKAK